jgi:hypothetical protein
MRVACITMVYNEEVFLPIWLEHYGESIGYENLYVLDHGSTDESVFNQKIKNIIKLPRGLLDEDTRAASVSLFHSLLLGYYDVVIYTDVDELIVPDPQQYSDVMAYLEANQDLIIRVVGVNVIHNYHEEPGVDLKLNILPQRKYYQLDGEYCKPVISRIPIKWSSGFHNCDQQSALKTDIFLLHLRAFDHEYARNRHQKLQKIECSQNSLNKRHSVQFRMSTREYLNFLFPSDPNAFKEAREGMDITDEIKSLVDQGQILRKRGSVRKFPSQFFSQIEKRKRLSRPFDRLRVNYFLDHLSDCFFKGSQAR